jgi:solute:Na+ symporter, SSS family
MHLIAAATSTARVSLHPVDIAIVAGYLVAMLGLGVWVGRGQKTTVDYFLGGRSLPWWAVLLSIVSTETSAVTFLSVPGMAFAAGGDLRFLQITFGYIVGRLAIIALLLPLYFRGEPFTAYEVLERRFGKTSRRVSSLLFIVTRNLADALRLYLAALVLQEAVGLEMRTCIVIVGAVTVTYTYLGGVKSVVWNDCIQFTIYIIGAAVILYKILDGLPGGWEQFWEFGVANDKFRVFDFEWSLYKPTMTFWAGLIGGMFLTGSTHGTDHLTVQRLLAARSQREAGWALGISGFIVLFQFALFLIIGAALACFYEQLYPDPSMRPQQGDRVVAHFIIHHLSTPMIGLTLAAVFAAAFSSSLNPLAQSLVGDIVIPLARRPLSREAQMRWGRLATLAFGVLQIFIALVSYRAGASENVVNSVLGIAAFTSGPMLGLYLLGVLTPRVSERPAIGGFIIGLVALTYVVLPTIKLETYPDWWFWHDPSRTPIYWPWLATIGAGCTFGMGYLLSWTPLNQIRTDADSQLSPGGAK